MWKVSWGGEKTPDVKRRSWTWRSKQVQVQVQASTLMVWTGQMMRDGVEYTSLMTAPTEINDQCFRV